MKVSQVKEVVTRNTLTSLCGGRWKRARHQAKEGLRRG